MNKPNRKYTATQLMDYRDVPAQEIMQVYPATTKPLVIYSNLGEKWEFQLDRRDQVDFEA